jgi:hypothetical protein
MILPGDKAGGPKRFLAYIKVEGPTKTGKNREGEEVY